MFQVANATLNVMQTNTLMKNKVVSTAKKTVRNARITKLVTNVMKALLMKMVSANHVSKTAKNAITPLPAKLVFHHIL